MEVEVEIEREHSEGETYSQYPRLASGPSAMVEHMSKHAPENVRYHHDMNNGKEMNETWV